MKHYVYRILLLLLVTAVLLSGCGKEKSGGHTGSQQWTKWPQLSYGTMASDKLQLEQWNSGRLEETSQYTMAETELGYYMLHNGMLYYADKTDLNRLVPACNIPKCGHDPHMCVAHYMGTNIFVQNDRIYFTEYTYNIPELYQTKATGVVIASKALDGTDVRLEYKDENMFSPDSGGHMIIQWFNGEYWIYHIAKLNKDGSYTLQCYRVTEAGAELLVDKTVADYNKMQMVSQARGFSLIFGEPSFNHEFLGEIPYSECRYKDGELYFTDLTGYYEDGRYLAGNLLRCYRMNDGYYDVNLDTKEEVRIADAYLENSQSLVILPNCVIEGTMLWEVYDQQPEGSTNAMAIFDGESWRDVELPEELLPTDFQNVMLYCGVSSDSIFFKQEDLRGFDQLYRIDLTQDALKLEHCARLSPTPNK